MCTLVQNDEWVDANTPATADQLVTVTRLEGRVFHREGGVASDCPYPSAGGSNDMRTQWMLGFYDIGLEKYYE